MSRPGDSTITWERSLSRFAPILVFVVAVSLAIWAIVAHRGEVESALEEVAWWSIPVSCLAYLLGLLSVFRAWAALIEDAGVHLTGRQSLRIYGIGQVAKYMPGGVWSVAMQSQMVRQFGGSRLRMASASLVILLLGVAVSLAMGSALLPLSGEKARHQFWFTPLLAIGMAVLLVPSVLNRASSLVARLVRRQTDPPAYTRSGVLTACTWMLLGNLMFGLHIQVIGASLGVDGIKGYLLSTSAYCLSASLGLLFIPAPAGAGVRELVIIIILAPTVSTGGALVVALTSRVIAIVSDLILASSQLRRRHDGTRRPVFVTRRFPPSVGGMETLAVGVWRSIQAVRPDAILIAHRGSNQGLIWWVPCAWVRVTLLAIRGRADFVLAGDAPTFALIEPTLRMTGVRRATMVLGLDVTHDNLLYRRFVLRPLRRAPRVVAISSATREEAVAAGVSRERTSVVRLGVELPSLSADDRRSARIAISRSLGLAAGDVVLLTLGRLVKRKGSRWFIEEVLPGLPESTRYVVAGDGPERNAIADAAVAAGVSARVHLLGQVSDAQREELMRGCDLFVQPNIPVPGDMEGFGLVTIEAAMRGAVVVASDIEGLRDAVVPDSTGYLVPSAQPSAWLHTLEHLIEDPEALKRLGWKFREAAAQRYGESTMAAGIQEVVFGRACPPDDPSSAE